MAEFMDQKVVWGLCEISGLSEAEQEEIFYPKNGDPRLAAAFCIECELREPCLDYAVQQNYRSGIWGARNVRQRLRIARRWKAQNSCEEALPPHSFDTEPLPVPRFVVKQTVERPDGQLTEEAVVYDREAFSGSGYIDDPVERLAFMERMKERGNRLRATADQPEI